MDDLFTPLAHARRTDPDTSREAANDISSALRQIQIAVLQFAAMCGVRGFTDPELSDYFDTTSSTYRTRRSELVTMGMVEDTGERVAVGPKGRRHAIWRITPKGQAEVMRQLPEAA